jgi:hypothetical protein
MKRRLLIIVLWCSFFSCAFADSRVQLTSSLMFRYEVQQFPDTREDVKRTRLRWRPAFSFQAYPSLQIGAEAEINWIHESDEEDAVQQFHIASFDRDNFKRDDIVLSKAFVRFTPRPDIELIGGKFDNPFLTTEMLWDRDLRPNGAAITMSHSFAQEAFTFKGTFGDFFATHYLHDRSNVIGIQGQLQASSGPARFTFAAAYYDYNTDELDPSLLRGNTRIGSLLLNDYNLIDLIGRVRFGSHIPLTAQIDYVKNTAADIFLPGLGNGDQGYMIDVFAGQLQSKGQFRAGINYHHVESDAVLAAYNIDDWWFPTRGEGWRFHGGYMIFSELSVQFSYLRQTFIDQEPLFERWMFTAEFNWP